MDKQDADDQRRAADASSAQLADVHVAPRQRATAREQEHHADEQAAGDGARRARVQRRLEQAHHGGDAHQARGEAPQQRSERRGATLEQDDRNRPEAGCQCRARAGEGKHGKFR